MNGFPSKHLLSLAFICGGFPLAKPVRSRAFIHSGQSVEFGDRVLGGPQARLDAASMLKVAPACSGTGTDKPVFQPSLAVMFLDPAFSISGGIMSK